MQPQTLLDRLAYGTIKILNIIWKHFGEPCPRLVRFVRHKFLGHKWPANSIPNLSLASDNSAELQETGDVAVIIPCHNYGHFLSEAIESVLAQTIKPIEIIVVDDASTDNTKEIATIYAKQGVKYVRNEWSGVGAARNTGMDNTKASYIICLDADDVIHPEYIRCGLRVLQEHPEAAIAYTDQQCFGEKNWRYRSPDCYDWRSFDTVNHFNSCAMVRREALLQAGGWSNGVTHHGDWVTWRRILRIGWKAAKSDGLFFYRKHGANMFPVFEKESPYPQRSGFLEEPATLFLPLSGREWAWPLTAEFLEKQTMSHNRIHLVIMDTSQNTMFGNIVRNWLSKCDYQHQTYIQEAVGPPGLAEQFRGKHSTNVALACSIIYNRFARLCTTPLALFLEDDIIPPLDAYERLTKHFNISVISVSGAYMHRDRPTPVAWKWKKDGRIQGIEALDGVTPVGGNGFGCLAMRGEFLRHTIFHSGPPSQNFDHNFYHSFVYQEGFEALVDWDCRCKHYRSQNDYVFPKIQTACAPVG